MPNDQLTDEGYRLNVGMVITNQYGQLLSACRVGQANAWQFPQGGIHEGEGILQAMYRELEEELGLLPQHVNVIAQAKQYLSYELPQALRGAGKVFIRGQKQQWFLLRLLVDDSFIDLKKSGEAEFSHWRWVDYWQPLQEIVYFKRELYRLLLTEFASLV